MHKDHDNNSRLVYSTEHGATCPKCKKPVSKCTCKKKQEKPKRDGIVRIQRQTKGRKGKAVTLITGLPLTMDGLRSLSKELKQKCGCGGTVKEGVIEIQGDQCDTIMDELKERGYQVKRSGG